MAWTDVVSAVASAGAALTALWVSRRSLELQNTSLELQQLIADKQREQSFAYAGAAAAISWRQQVLDLHDRGLSAEQIRSIMLLEEGGEGYEAGNGRIDDILRNVPRRQVGTA